MSVKGSDGVMEHWIRALHTEELAPLWVAWAVLRGTVKTSLASRVKQTQHTQPSCSGIVQEG